MAILKLRIYLEEDDAVYRDILIQHTQNFYDLHLAILKAYGFDTKFQATFYRSNDKWQQGREISLEKYADHAYRAEPLLMQQTTLASEILNPDQKFIYLYDFAKNWTFWVEFIGIEKNADKKKEYPTVSRVEGIGPQQYGTKSLLGEKFVDIEEKYDLSAGEDGFGQEGEDGSSDADSMSDDDFGGEE